MRRESVSDCAKTVLPRCCITSLSEIRYQHRLHCLSACRYPDGTVKLRNPNIELMDQDILYHLALGSGSHDLVEMFGDVKVIEIHK